jgi:hypothetical protein
MLINHLLIFTRRLTAVVSGFFALSSMGGIVLGTSWRDGAFLAVACLSAGIALATGMWSYLSRNPAYRRHVLGLFLLCVCLGSGFALYSNLVYLFWGMGFPLEIGTVKAGKMAEVYWLPPATLLYAAGAYAGLAYFAKQPPEREL